MTRPGRPEPSTPRPTIARRNLRKLQRTHPRGQAAKTLAVWGRLLAEPTRLEAIAEALTSKSRRAVELAEALVRERLVDRATLAERIEALAVGSGERAYLATWLRARS